jgi:AcrR family transcriptional regulator
MMFGKRGRPAEDRLLRQYEIYDAVAPLILRDGARKLSMRQAAQAACLSIGGLYHYFPTKRDLVLHGLCPEAIQRGCDDFTAQFGHLAESDPQRFWHEGIEAMVRRVEFCRPALHAALELGGGSFWEVIDTLLSRLSIEIEEAVQRVAPQVSDEEAHRCGSAMRRAFSAALLDKSASSDDMREEMHILIDGYVNRGDRTELVPAPATVRATCREGSQARVVRERAACEPTRVT